jgi:hypothetical protein
MLASSKHYYIKSFSGGSSLGTLSIWKDSAIFKHIVFPITNILSGINKSTFFPWEIFS